MKNTLRQIFHSSKFVVGFAIFVIILLIMFIYPLINPGDPLEMIGVEPKWRGRGVASAMIDEALMQLSSQRVGYLCARSMRRNKSAMQMFKRAGFEWIRTDCYLLGRDM